MYTIFAQKDASGKDLSDRIASFLSECKFKYNFGICLETRFILCIGDDNFLLHTFRDLGERQIPVLGIGVSSSFLSEANSSNFEECINLIEKGKFHVEKKTRLIAKMGKVYSPNALNDIAIFPRKSASILRYSLFLNDELFWKDMADGFLVSTPTGSTGYSFSIGGPIVLNEPSVVSLSPVSSLDKTHGPIVVNDCVEIKLAGIQAGSVPEVIIDGEIRIPFRATEIEIKKSAYPALFVKFDKKVAIGARLKKRTLCVDSEKISKLPASSKLLHKILVYEGEMTQKELILESMLPERTVRYGLDVLLVSGVISKKPSLKDTRQTIYFA